MSQLAPLCGGRVGFGLGTTTGAGLGVFVDVGAGFGVVVDVGVGSDVAVAVGSGGAVAVGVKLAVGDGVGGTGVALKVGAMVAVFVALATGAGDGDGSVSALDTAPGETVAAAGVTVAAGRGVFVGVDVGAGAPRLHPPNESTSSNRPTAASLDVKLALLVVPEPPGARENSGTIPGISRTDDIRLCCDWQPHSDLAYAVAAWRCQRASNTR